MHPELVSHSCRQALSPLPSTHTHTHARPPVVASLHTLAATARRAPPPTHSQNANTTEQRRVDKTHTTRTLATNETPSAPTPPLHTHTHTNAPPPGRKPTHT